ncbi:hypothetical protein K1T71_013578 [Dendrolimus kikuchii]|uniref:Uncharacterized protein n=1 Tax=Dendrolimus kikuchii TaxID=765133 RepID=A0ACC1CGU4_9NEOP|nr:hypothetical protein K1T71_013578 [Dendrolimus kikuchii]
MEDYATDPYNVDCYSLNSMPRKYFRTTLRASWLEADLTEAIQKVRRKEMGVNEAARTYNIYIICNSSKGKNETNSKKKKG